MTWEEGGPGGSDQPGPEHVLDVTRARLSLVGLLASRVRLRFTGQIAKVPHTRRGPWLARWWKSSARGSSWSRRTRVRDVGCPADQES